MIKDRSSYMRSSKEILTGGGYVSSIRSLLLILLLTAIAPIISSCEPPKSDVQHKQKQTVAKESKIPTNIFKGMISLTDKNILQDCSSGTKYKISGKSNLAAIDNAAGNLRSRDRFYVEAEGFVSYETNATGKGMDTVLVIGNVSRIDLQFDCLPAKSE